MALSLDLRNDDTRAALAARATQPAKASLIGLTRAELGAALVAAGISCARISSAVRLRTSFCVPVWQNEQVSVQPTWLEMQSVPRPSSGM
jgi:hypothetical protein